MCEFRGNIGQHGDDADPAQRLQRNDLVVVAGVQLESIPAELLDLGNLRDVAAGFLDADDIFHILHQRSRCFRGNVRACAGRNIVHDDRRIRYRFRNLCVMTEQAALCGFVVIRCDQQQGIHAKIRRLAAHLNGALCAVGTSPCDDRNTSSDCIHAALDHVHVLRHIQCGRLAGRTADDDGIRALRDLPLQDLIQLFRKKRTVFMHRRNDRHAGTSEN